MRPLWGWGGAGWLVAVAAVGLSLVASCPTSQHENTTHEPALSDARDQCPKEVSPENWLRLVAAAEKASMSAGTDGLCAHEIQIITNTLEHFAAQDLPSDERYDYYEGFVRWGVPRFLGNAPSEADTARLLQQIDGLSEWMETEFREAAFLQGHPDVLQARVERWRANAGSLATTIRTGTALHPLAERDLESVKQAFREALESRVRDGAAPHRVLFSASAQATHLLTLRASRPPVEDLPQELSDLAKRSMAADRRQAEKLHADAVAGFRSSVVADELSGGREDLEAWAMLIDAALINSLLGDGAATWACSYEVVRGEKGPRTVHVKREAAGNIQFTPQPRNATTLAKSHWGHGQIAVEGGRLAVKPRGGTEAWRPLEGREPAQGIRHYGTEAWADALADQWNNSARLWTVLVPLLATPLAGDDQVTVDPPVGLLPFCATPRVALLAAIEEPGDVRFVARTAHVIGRTTCTYGFGHDALKGTPSLIVLEMEPRELQGSVTMRVTSDTDTEPGDQTWSASMPAPIRTVSYTLGEPMEGLAIVEEVEATDNEGEPLCTITTSDFRPR